MALAAQADAERNPAWSAKLVFLHAFPLDSRMWEEQQTVLPGRIETPDLYTRGDTLEQWAEDILDSVGDGPLIVVGSSMGGSCALELAQLAPDRVAALVLVGTKAGHHPDPAYRDACIARLEQGGADAIWDEIRNDLIGSQAPAAVVDRIRTLMRAQRTEDLIRGVRAFHGRQDLSQFAARWNKPLLVICGDKDRVVTVGKTAKFVASTRSGTLHVMRDCGHYMNMERPLTFNRIIRDFID
jgi:pimeloyl-ACP methyl ester carboxylesterase